MSEKKGSNKLLVILLVVMFLILVSVASFFGYYVFLKPKLAANSQGTTKTEKPVNEKIMPVNEIITNLADVENNKYIKITIKLGYSDKKLDKELPLKMDIIRNDILIILRNKRSEDFSGQGYEKVVNELKDKINSVLVGGKVTNIYLNDFIIQ